MVLPMDSSNVASFTDWDICKNKEGTHSCIECATCIKTRDLRTNNLVADKNKIYLLKKNDLEEVIFNLDNYINGEFVIGITRSFKKHNSFRCTVNTDTNIFYVREEDKEYIFDTNITKPLYKQLNEAYLYFSKDELLTGQYNIHSIMEFGLNEFSRYEEVFKQHRGTHYFDLLIYLMNAEKRNEAVQKKINREKEKKKQEKGQVNLFEIIGEE